MFKINTNVARVKEIHQQFRKFVNFCVVLMLIFALAYLLYYQYISNDQWEVFEDTKSVFLPVANFFFPGDTSDSVFLNTSLCLFGCTIPIILLYYISDYVKDLIIKLNYMAEKAEANKDIKRLKDNELLQYEVIRYSSICVYLDWELEYGEKRLDDEARNKLNASLYEKIKSALSKVAIKKDMSTGNTFIMQIDDLKHFDVLFEMIINLLAKIKMQVEKSGTMEMVPTITIDAFPQKETYENIEKNHFKIMDLNFKNKAFSSTLFVKKYNYLGLKKYAGYSIGDYAIFNDHDTESVELYIVYDNLNDELGKINRTKY